MILGAEMTLVWPRASPADSRRSSVPVVPKNFPTRRPIVLPGTLTPDAAEGRLTRKSFACEPTATPEAPTLSVIGASLPLPVDVVRIELSPHWIPSPREQDRKS